MPDSEERDASTACVGFAQENLARNDNCCVRWCRDPVTDVTPGADSNSTIENRPPAHYNHLPMAVTVRSFAKINLGLCIGPLRPDGFHELRTVYQTIALHDVIRVEVRPGAGIEILCTDLRVPKDASNTCYGMVERAMSALKARGRVTIHIEKRLPVQGGLGGASGNAVATLLALEREVRKQLSLPEKLRLAAEVGSDLPLFLVGGTVLGVRHGEEVYPLADLPAMPCVVVTPKIAVSTPKAFADWDSLCGAGAPARGDVELRSTWPGQRPGPSRPVPGTAEGGRPHAGAGPHHIGSGAPAQAQSLPKLTASSPSDRMTELGRVVAAWLSGLDQRGLKAGKTLSGVPVKGGRGRAETPLLDLVRTGIENDFERVVFPQYPELCEAKRLLERAGARYASLSGSGSALYGLFASRAAAQGAAGRLRKTGIPAAATTTLTRRQYRRKIFD
jgi:4-diphosphocytidyl-2-C-methyl-D-erythritol kinase